MNTKKLEPADIRAKALIALAGADQSFAHTGDVIEAFGWVAFAARQGYTLPPRIGARLGAALDAYRSGEANTLDEAFKINIKGAGHPQRKLLEKTRLQGALSRMHVLRCQLGATVLQAAELVATLYPISWRQRRWPTDIAAAGSVRASCRLAGVRWRCALLHRLPWPVDGGSPSSTRAVVEDILREFPERGPWKVAVRLVKADLRRKNLA